MGPGNHGFRFDRLDGDRHRLMFRVAASRLEVCSDATGWAPIDARSLGRDRWEVELAMSPGVHRVAIRVDGGAWSAPPGVPATLDDFGGEVGLIVVE